MLSFNPPKIDPFEVFNKYIPLCVVIAFCILFLRYTNADLKIFLYVSIHIKTISRKIRILNPENSRVIRPQSLRNVYLQTYRNNRICCLAFKKNTNFTGV